MKFNLNNKWAIVTGGVSGIGDAIVQCFIEQGAIVHVLDLTTLENKKNLYYHECDISNLKTVEKVIEKIVNLRAEKENNNSINILVNNAGIAHIGNIENTEEDDLDSIYQVNVKGVFNCIKSVIGKMKTNGGVIINMASIVASVGIKNRYAYSMSKGAIKAMTFSLAKDYIDYGIRCNCVSPARVHTPFVDGYLDNNYPDNKDEMFDKLSKTQPIGRMAKPKEVADLVLYLCSDEAAFATGIDYAIDGGFTTLNGD